MRGVLRGAQAVKGRAFLSPRESALQKLFRFALNSLEDSIFIYVFVFTTSNFTFIEAQGCLTCCALESDFDQFLIAAFVSTRILLRSDAFQGIVNYAVVNSVQRIRAITAENLVLFVLSAPQVWP